MTVCKKRIADKIKRGKQGGEKAKEAGLFLDRVKRGLLAAVNADRLYMDSSDGNDVSVVFRVEVVQIGGVLEVVRVDFAALNYIVGLNVIGELLDVEGYVLLGEDILCNGENFSVRSGRCGDGNGLAGKRVVIDSGIVAVGGIVYDRDYGSVILGGDEIGDPSGFQAPL